MSIRVVMTATIKPEDADAFERAYLDVTSKVQGTPGHLRDVLLRDSEDATRYSLIAEWESERLFRAWADDPEHMRQSAAMYPYWADTFRRSIYEVRAALDSTASGAGGGTAVPGR
ncbi:antibiotic biosynthesis monooxygenase family protein [Actinacidiphila acididurans]|uniref:Antibiotic biosynthesis monooxygenase n=1 Tax=Actinacidiphila acididurans TaxID=2784346 RepID=A0ABS2TYY8_9ACTN|nr:antibiotic biosynthesis monooxygenase family protein [Actinacidiphila acididurans]MBM9508201.1 antibiotic biosynthesis monooxygenase [Actinacidiphila acididurans]